MEVAVTWADLWVGVQVAGRMLGLLAGVVLAAIILAAVIVPWKERH